MILRSDFTMEELKKDSDPLSYVCHPISKLKLISNLIHSDSGNTSGRFLEVFTSADVYAMGEIIDDCALEIETLVDIAEDQARDEFHENKRLKGELYELKIELGERITELEKK